MKNHPYNELYDFQQDGVKFVQNFGGGFIWDDPGLGKTRQAIVSADLLGESPILVVCPSSLKSWWKQEIRAMFPNASICIAGVGGRFGSHNNQILPKKRPLARWWIVHYTGISLNPALCRIPWKTVILDECHYIKNRKAQRTKAVMNVTPKYANRIGLTATPFGNSPSDLWSQLYWMAPDVKGLRSYWRFFNIFVDYDWEVMGNRKYRKVKDGRNLKVLSKLMSAYGVRRDKKVVAKQLPPMTDTFLPLSITAAQGELYRRLKHKTNVEIELAGGKQLVIPNVLSRMLRMEQVLSHPWTFIPEHEGAKMEWLKGWVLGYDKQALIVTRFKESSRHIAEWLKTKKCIDMPRCRNAITGDVSTKSRSSIISDWKKGKHQFIVGTIDTLGIGLSFPEAHHMVAFDIVPSVIKMDQVRHRIHRLTTKNPVEIIYPLIEHTTNALMLKSVLEKWRQLELVREFIKHMQEE